MVFVHHCTEGISDSHLRVLAAGHFALRGSLWASRCRELLVEADLPKLSSHRRLDFLHFSSGTGVWHEGCWCSWMCHEEAKHHPLFQPHFLLTVSGSLVWPWLKRLTFSLVLCLGEHFQGVHQVSEPTSHKSQWDCASALWWKFPHLRRVFLRLAPIQISLSKSGEHCLSRRGFTVPPLSV